jgi:methylated-DNA-[protein]-cysteine S-methyltransferase
VSTAFQRRVWGLLATIPRGRVATYKELARALSCGSPRAVGQALKQNPDAPRVPCHRIIRSDLTIGGYQGKTRGRELENKRRLLAGEGVTFGQNGVLTDPQRLFHFGAASGWND